MLTPLMISSIAAEDSLDADVFAFAAFFFLTPLLFSPFSHYFLSYYFFSLIYAYH